MMMNRVSEATSCCIQIQPRHLDITRFASKTSDDNTASAQHGISMLFLLSCTLGMTVSSPGALSFASGLLSPYVEAAAVLGVLRAKGISHLAAIAGSESIDADLLASGNLDALLGVTATGEPTASPEIVTAVGEEQWVHVCTNVKELAGAKRVGARTIWLNAAAAADENSKGFEGEPGAKSGYVARGIIADLADGVCSTLETLPAAIDSAQEAHELNLKREERQAEAADAAAGGGVGSGAGRESKPASDGKQISCVSCGARLPASAKFCSECGDDLSITLLP